MTVTEKPLFSGLGADPAEMVGRYQRIRRRTEELCAPLEPDDYMLQAMPDASPAKWHLGHVSWFFETFLLRPRLDGYKATEDMYQFLFNSYYNGAGPQWYRPARGQLSRPTVPEVYDFRAHINGSMVELVESTSPDELEVLGSLMTLGLNHEQQHQELLVTDLKYNLSVNPLRPAYHETPPATGEQTDMEWVGYEGGIHHIGHDREGFAFDNEWPRHEALLHPYQLASRPTTNGEYIEFMEAGGYTTPDHWLSEGWKTVQSLGWIAPLYWEKIDGRWWSQTMSGMRPIDEHGPVAHVSYYEADAYARWAGKRLPTEQEWERAAADEPIEGNFADSGRLHPSPASEHSNSGHRGRLRQIYGDLWEWTQSPYSAYPGFQPLEGTVGEYNGKFMVNQMVLRGGSCATPADHIRPSYRNFFPADARWQFSGIRLADNAS